MTAREDLAHAWATKDMTAFAKAYERCRAEVMHTTLPPDAAEYVLAIDQGTPYAGSPGADAKEITLTHTDLTHPKYTYRDLRAYLDEHGVPGDSAHHEGLTARLPEFGVTVHDHPHSGAGRELHVMVNGLKTAEIGPPDDSDLRDGEVDDNVPGYIDFLAQWAGRDVTDEQHARIKLKIALDNGLQGAPDTLQARGRALVAWGKGGNHTSQNTTVYEGFTAGWQAAVEFMTR